MRALKANATARTIDELLARPTVSINKACALVGVSRRTIYNWMTAGKLDCVRIAGGSVRIFADSLWRPPTEKGERHE